MLFFLFVVIFLCAVIVRCVAIFRDQGPEVRGCAGHGDPRPRGSRREIRGIGTLTFVCEWERPPYFQTCVPVNRAPQRAAGSPGCPFPCGSSQRSPLATPGASFSMHAFSSSLWAPRGRGRGRGGAGAGAGVGAGVGGEGAPLHGVDVNIHPEHDCYQLNGQRPCVAGSPRYS